MAIEKRIMSYAELPPMESEIVWVIINEEIKERDVADLVADFPEKMSTRRGLQPKHFVYELSENNQIIGYQVGFWSATGETDHKNERFSDFGADGLVEASDIIWEFALDDLQSSERWDDVFYHLRDAKEFLETGEVSL